MNQATKTPFRVLIVDDERLFARAIGRELERQGIEVELAYTAAEALERVQGSSFGAILWHHKLRDDEGSRFIPMF